MIRPRLLLTAFVSTLAATLGTHLPAIEPFDLTQELEIELTGRGDLSIDALHYFTQGVERTFARRAFPGTFTVERWSGASQTEKGPLLDLQLIRWSEWTPSDFECRVYATALSAGERVDLGVFVGRADAFAPTIHQQEERLIQSAAAAVNRIYDALQNQGLLPAKPTDPAPSTQNRD